MSNLSDTQAKKYAVLLKDIFLFRGFTGIELAALLRTPGICVSRYAAGETLLSPSCSHPQLCILLRGAAVVEKQSGESLLRMRELGPGAVFGIASLFLDEEQRPYPTHITALKNSSMLVIPEPAFKALLEKDFRFTENYIRYLTGKIHYLHSRIDGLILQDASERVLLYLEQNAKDHRMVQGLTQLAQALSVSRATLYRALNTLEQGGRIRRNGREIELLEHTQIKDILEERL